MTALVFVFHFLDQVFCYSHNHAHYYIVAQVIERHMTCESHSPPVEPRGLYKSHYSFHSPFSRSMVLTFAHIYSQPLSLYLPVSLFTLFHQFVSFVSLTQHLFVRELYLAIQMSSNTCYPLPLLNNQGHFLGLTGCFCENMSLE